MQSDRCWLLHLGKPLPTNQIAKLNRARDVIVNTAARAQKAASSSSSSAGTALCTVASFELIYLLTVEASLVFYSEWRRGEGGEIVVGSGDIKLTEQIRENIASHDASCRVTSRPLITGRHSPRSNMFIWLYITITPNYSRRRKSCLIFL